MNRATILRLARYLRVLHKLKGLGFVKVFSNNLGDSVGVTPAVVRKDFSLLAIGGNKRGGYTVDVLIERLEAILGKEESHDVVVVGCGRIGSALLEYSEFTRDGIRVVAGLDADPDKVSPDARIPIYPIDQLAEVAERHGVTVGIVTVPDAAALQVFRAMLDAGIRGFLNFTAVELKCQSVCDFDSCATRCVVQNVNIGLEIENLFYLLKMNPKSELAGTPETSAVPRA
ncbi:MAG: redox-sensing transcriptional repressor Rex [Spirochaetaceae bacterium]|nr:MAG: redox-sensing transcriptional repressor Rex [Spirochaetaceae bacterium]